VDSSITKAFEEKMKLVSQILHIPPNNNSGSTPEDNSVELAPARDAKELVVACMQQGKLYPVLGLQMFISPPLSL
jgi:hypothetical protein